MNSGGIISPELVQLLKEYSDPERAREKRANAARFSSDNAMRTDKYLYDIYDPQYGRLVPGYQPEIFNTDENRFNRLTENWKEQNIRMLENPEYNLRNELDKKHKERETRKKKANDRDVENAKMERRRSE